MSSLFSSYVDGRQLPEEYVASPATNIHHIIWNLVITDKLTELTPDILEENKIKHILAILPETDDFLTLNQEIPEFSYDVLAYGHAHDMSLNVELYDTYCQKIDDIARTSDIRNVLLFCNNGYQRSIPFLVYYLIHYHVDEVPTIEKAVEIILSQIDKEHFMERKDGMVENITQLLSSSGDKDQEM
jgi:hypothetical protein